MNGRQLFSGERKRILSSHRFKDVDGLVHEQVPLQKQTEFKMNQHASGQRFARRQEHLASGLDCGLLIALLFNNLQNKKRIKIKKPFLIFSYSKNGVGVVEPHFGIESEHHQTRIKGRTQPLHIQERI